MIIHKQSMDEKQMATYGNTVIALINTYIHTCIVKYIESNTNKWRLLGRGMDWEQNIKFWGRA